MSLYTFVALSDNHPDGTCWAWMEGAQRVCGAPECDEPHLCPRHVKMARRKRHIAAEKAAAQRATREARALANLPHQRDRLARIEAEIARRDPTPPTTDLAAYGGVGSTAATGYQRRLLSDSNITALAKLHQERTRLASDVAHGEHVAAQLVDFPDQTCAACGLEHPGADCQQPDLFEGAS